MVKLLTFILTMLLVIPISPVIAKNSEPVEVVYYGFDPDIVTNYVADNRRTLGYVRVSVELMLPSKDALKTIEYHEPIILDRIIGILSKQPEQKIKSLTGREEVRLQILEELQQLLKRETGQTMVQDVLFTKFLYQ